MSGCFSFLLVPLPLTTTLTEKSAVHPLLSGFSPFTHITFTSLILSCLHPEPRGYCPPRLHSITFHPTSTLEKRVTPQNHTPASTTRPPPKMNESSGHFPSSPQESPPPLLVHNVPYRRAYSQRRNILSSAGRGHPRAINLWLHQGPRRLA